MKNKLFNIVSFVLLLTLSSCNNANSNNQSNTNNSINNTSINEDITSIHTHKPSEVIIENKIEATCIKEGSYDEVIYCLECHEELSRTHKINNPTGHLHLDTREENRVEPTCTDRGSYDLITYCQDDNVIISKEHKSIDALGHDYSDWKVIEEANDYQDGLKEKECSRCHDKIEEIIPTTSRFSFKLNNDKSSYTVNGFNADEKTTPNTSYTKGMSLIEIPETFNNLPVTNIELSFVLLKDEVVPTISINKEMKINCLKVSKYRDFIKDNAVFNTLRNREVSINIHYKGNLSDWLTNRPINKKTNFDLGQSLYNLFLYDGELNTFVQVDTLNIQEGIETINDYAFSHVQFNKLICPSSLKSIGASAFFANHKLSEVSLNEGLTSIKALAFNMCRNLKSFTLPSSVNNVEAGAINDELFEITVKKGASGYIDSLKAIPYLYKIIDENLDTSYIDETRYITKNNLENSAVFIYQKYKVLKINNSYKLLSYQFNENDDENLKLPEKLIYQDQEVTQYGIHDYFISQSVPLGLSFEKIIGAYENIQEMREYYAYPNDLFFNLYIPHAVISIDKNAFINVRFIQNIFFDGTYQEWQNMLKQSGSSNFRLAQTQVVHVKNESDTYIEMPLYS